MITDKDRIIDDIGFRNAWNEKTVRMNIEMLTNILAANQTLETLRSAVEGLKIATENELLELQICAAQRMAAYSAPPTATILQMFRPTPASQASTTPRASVPA